MNLSFNSRLKNDLFLHEDHFRFNKLLGFFKFSTKNFIIEYVYLQNLNQLVLL